MYGVLDRSATSEGQFLVSLVHAVIPQSLLPCGIIFFTVSCLFSLENHLYEFFEASDDGAYFQRGFSFASAECLSTTGSGKLLTQVLLGTSWGIWVV